MMHLRNGETKNYSESSSRFELAVVDTTDATADMVVAITDNRLRQRGDIQQQELPFTVRIKTFYANSALAEKPGEGLVTVPATAGIGTGLWWAELPHVTEMTRLIHARGAKVRLHCHGKMRHVLDMILETGCDGIDPCEPPPDGDIELDEVKRRCRPRGVSVWGNMELKLDRRLFGRRVFPLWHFTRWRRSR
jgi:hypothetical protein